MTGNGTNNKSQWAEWTKPQPVEVAKPQPSEALRPQPARSDSRAIRDRQRPAWPYAVRMLGVAVAVIAGIVLFKLFGTGHAPQPMQFSNPMPTISAKNDSASKLRSSDNGQSIGPSGGTKVPVPDSNSQRGSALLPDAVTTSPPPDNGPKLTGGA